MRMVFLLGVVLTLGSAPSAHAQWLPLDGRLILDVSGLYQAHSQTLRQRDAFDLYDEQGNLESATDVKGGSLWDVGFGYSAWRNLSVGLGISQFARRSSLTTTGNAPHPLFFDAPRAFQTERGDVRHKARVIYLQAMWAVQARFLGDVRLVILAGPAHVRVTQGLLQGVGTRETGAPFGSVDVSTSVASRTKSAIGGVLGVDVSYPITRNIGAGLLLRYVGGSVRVSGLDGQSVGVDAGGFQAGGGVRLRF